MITKIKTYVTKPLKIRGEYAQGEFRIPIATREKALIAGIGRGVKAANACGGIEVRIIKDEMARAPVFYLNNLEKADEVCKYIKENKEALAHHANSTTRYGKLTSVKPALSGNYLHPRMGMTTGDAAGQNMITKAVLAASEFLEKELSYLTFISVTGNCCTSKKASKINSIEGRGKWVTASVEVPESVCKEVFKTTLSSIEEVFRAKENGSLLAGCPNNVHHANMLAAIYLSTGQDIANIVEGSQGTSQAKVRDNMLYFSVDLPAVIIGSIGGGTSARSSKKALKILGCYGSGNPIGGNAKKLAEIAGALVLAGELNLYAALTNSRKFVRDAELLERR